MARPRKEGMDYFPHDVHAASDKKVEALRMLYGNDGYAFYFIILETIYQEPNFELDVSDAETMQILARKVSVTNDLFDKMLATALKRECFNREAYEERRILTSNGIKKRANVVVEKREKMRSNHVLKVSGVVSGVVSDAEMGVETPQSKRKVKDKVKVKEDINTFVAYTTNTDLQESLNSFVEFRKKIKSPLTDRAVTLLLKNLDKLGKNDDEKISILEQSIVNGWKGIFELKGKTIRPSSANRQLSQNEKLMREIQEEMLNEQNRVETDFFGNQQLLSEFHD